MAISDRIDELLKERKMSRRQLAISAKIAPSSLQSAMERGDGFSVDMLSSIAAALHTPIDYLLGNTDVKDIEPDTAIICKYLGLSEKAVLYLKSLRELSAYPPYSKRIYLLSQILESKDFDHLLAVWEQYIGIMNTDTDLQFSMTSEYKMHSDALKKYGYVVSLPDNAAKALFDEQITNKLRGILDEIAENWTRNNITQA